MIVQIAGFVLVLVVWSFVRIQFLLSKQQNIEAAVYGGLLGLSSIIGSLFIAQVDIPSLITPFKIICEPIGKMILKQ